MLTYHQCGPVTFNQGQFQISILPGANELSVTIYFFSLTCRVSLVPASLLTSPCWHQSLWSPLRVMSWVSMFYPSCLPIGNGDPPRLTNAADLYQDSEDKKNNYLTFHTVACVPRIIYIEYWYQTIVSFCSMMFRARYHPFLSMHVNRFLNLQIWVMYIQEPNLTTTAPADVIAPSSTRPSAGTA